MRKRNNAIYLRLSDHEMKILEEKLSLSGLNKTEFFVAAITDTPVQPVSDREEVKQLNLMLWGICNQLRKIGININQLAHWANSTGRLCELEKMNQSLQLLDAEKEMIFTAWQSTKRLIQKVPKHTEQ